MIRLWKKTWLSKLIVYLLLVNFINLTANFYQASEMDSTLLQQHDPIDSIAELVLEYIFEMDDETIPDTEVPHEKLKISDIKLIFISNSYTFNRYEGNNLNAINFLYNVPMYGIDGEDVSPPPRLV